MKKKRWHLVVTACAAVLAVAVGVFCIATGPRNIAQYPPVSETPYLLPFPAGQTFLCVQSNRGVVSHRGREQFAYDFAMPVGTGVCAARAGTVTKVVMDHDGHGYKWPNNLIVVQHDDGTFGNYLHLKQNGAYVSVGDHVEQGQVIAASGHVGNSMMPHLHFHVTDAERKGTIPVVFGDLKRDAGIPRMFKWYTSGNTTIPSEQHKAPNE